MIDDNAKGHPQIEAAIAALLAENDCPCCGYGGFWGTVDPITGKPSEDMIERLRKMCALILKAGES